MLYFTNVIFSVLEMEIKLQVDDGHFLYVNGELVSSGTVWNAINTVTTSDAVTTIAIYAINTVSCICDHL